MSRIGKKPVQIPAGVTVTVDNTHVTVKGSKGELNRTFSELVAIKQEGEEILVSRVDESSESNAQQGLVRTLIHNMVIGVSEGLKKELEMRGVGYRAQLQGNKLVLAVGKSHPDEVEAPAGITFELPNPTTIVISGISKEKVGQTAAYVRSLRSPEPYKGKGIRYVGEYVRLKEGKTGK